jgi:Family of unknown function (DUF6069)
MPGYPDPPDPYPPDPYPTERFDRSPGVPPRPAARSPQVASRLWSAGLATAIVAALVALVGVLIVRALLRIDLYAPRAAGAFGNSSTVVLCVTAAVAALLATGLAHLLLLSTPRPLAYFSWIVGLLTAAAVVVPFTYASLTVALAQAVIHLVIGLAIGSLLSGAAASASRSAALSNRPYQVE